MSFASLMVLGVAMILLISSVAQLGVSLTYGRQRDRLRKELKEKQLNIHREWREKFLRDRALYPMKVDQEVLRSRETFLHYLSEEERKTFESEGAIYCKDWVLVDRQHPAPNGPVYTVGTHFQVWSRSSEKGWWEMRCLTTKDREEADRDLPFYDHLLACYLTIKSGQGESLLRESQSSATVPWPLP